MSGRNREKQYPLAVSTEAGMTAAASANPLLQLGGFSDALPNKLRRLSLVLDQVIPAQAEGITINMGSSALVQGTVAPNTKPGFDLNIESSAKSNITILEITANQEMNKGWSLSQLQGFAKENFPARDTSLCAYPTTGNHLPDNLVSPVDRDLANVSDNDIRYWTQRVVKADAGVTFYATYSPRRKIAFRFTHDFPTPLQIFRKFQVVLEGQPEDRSFFTLTAFESSKKIRFGFDRLYYAGKPGQVEELIDPLTDFFDLLPKG